MSDEELFDSDRRQVLALAVDHMLPAEPLEPVELDAVCSTLFEALPRGPFAAQAPWLAALADELADLGLAEAVAGNREPILRQVEGGDNPYLRHALGLLLRVALEAFLGDPDRGGNPEGVGWSAVGLPPAGFRRCLKPLDKADGG